MQVQFSYYYITFNEIMCLLFYKYIYILKYLNIKLLSITLLVPKHQP